MSIPTTRTALADALTTVDTVTGHRYPTTTKRPGDAWPLWVGATPPDDGRYAFTFVQAWRVEVVLPTDPEAADEWVAGHIDDLVDALAPHLSITGYGPARITPQGTTAAYNALVIEGETE